jgi:hypothetical protein
MAIEIASDNHINSECKPVTKTDLKDIKRGSLLWRTLDEWREDVDSSFYLDHDCSGTYGCEHGGEKYVSCVSVSTEDLEDSGEIPTWATHVMWYSK